jgi:rhamnosyltransferase
MGVGAVGRVDAVVFLTQDAVPETSESVKRLLAAFSDPRVGGAYGRQIPRRAACVLESFGRQYNYPAQGWVIGPGELRQSGLRGVFFSNSFGAFRLDALREIGGLSANVVFGEDMLTAARLIKAGWKVAYQSDACVIHSHRVTLLGELRRSFDMGVMHESERWLLEEFGSASGEGLRFFLLQACHCLHRKPTSLLKMAGQVMAKAVGYFLGRRFAGLPYGVCRTMSANRGFWLSSREQASSPRLAASHQGR